MFREMRVVYGVFRKTMSLRRPYPGRTEGTLGYTDRVAGDRLYLGHDSDDSWPQSTVGTLRDVAWWEDGHGPI